MDGTLLELQYQIAKLAERYWVWTPLVAMPRKFWNKWKLIVIAVVRYGVKWEMRVISLGAADIGSVINAAKRQVKYLLATATA